MKNPSDKDWKSIESEWRDRMQEEISPFPEGLWEKLSDRLDAEEKPKVFFIKTWPWAAVLAVAIGLTWYRIGSKTDVVVLGSTTVNHLPAAKPIEPSRDLSHFQPEGDEKKLSNPLKAGYIPSKSPITQPAAEPLLRLESLHVKEDVAIQQNSTLPSNIGMDKGEEKEEVIWVQVNIDPVLPVDEESPTLTGNQAQKKRNFGQLLKKIKQVIKGNPGEWSEIKENFHLVASKYVQTEEIIKQKIEF